MNDRKKIIQNLRSTNEEEDRRKRKKTRMIITGKKLSHRSTLGGALLAHNDHYHLLDAIALSYHMQY